MSEVLLKLESEEPEILKKRTNRLINGLMLGFCVALPLMAQGGERLLEQKVLEAVANLPRLPRAAKARPDWLVRTTGQKAGVFRGEEAREIVLDNGLLRREFRVLPNLATIGYVNLTTKEALLRGVKPEAYVELDGEKFAIGGLQGQPDYAYLKREWIGTLTADPKAFACTGFSIGATLPRMEWKRKRYASQTAYPPSGVQLTFDFAPPQGRLAGVSVQVHYELYDDIPLLCKWITLKNSSGKPIRLNSFTSEVLAVVEPESKVETAAHWEPPNLHIESDYSFIAVDPTTANKVARWIPDPQYTTQVNYLLQTPNLLECRPPMGPDVDVPQGETFESFRIWELLHDSTERERKGLGMRRMYRKIAPWATENPILMHVRDAKPESVKLAIDQCAEVGFEMVILSFGSGLNMENNSPDYLAKIKSLVDYAHTKGVELGGYSLLASRRISDEDDVINPKTGKIGGAIFDNSPCLGSRWGQDYFRHIKTFIEKTGFDLLEHDGSYPGDMCASTTHPGHKRLSDSQWLQWQQIRDFYVWCRGQGVYLNVPDWYFLEGANKTAMGYREVNWSLPRERQIILARQNMYDGTWQKTSSMGWMFVPLVEYQGGGAGATLEPLHEHLDAYGQHLAQNFLNGVQACYRGPRLYDTPETKAVVQKWVSLYKQYRDILDSDVIHLRRPDGRDYDGLLHVNPFGKHKGFAVIHNPLDTVLKTNVRLPLYYTGLSQFVSLSHEGGSAKRVRLERDYSIVVPVTIPARGLTWFAIE